MKAMVEVKQKVRCRMQIVIDIPDEEYERIKDMPKCYQLLIHKAVTNGTPLSKYCPHCGAKMEV